MRTVKEVSELTGISVRTLHYYDEIGLFEPTIVSEAGYRLYDDKALERLQQILFFREFDMPLKEIKSIMENPNLDKNQLLCSQKQVLILKKERLERLIASIDDILKGENRMDFEIFSKTDVEQLYEALVDHMSEENKAVFIEKYGSMEQYKKHFMESASGEKAQKNYAKLVEWYGDKDSVLAAGTNFANLQIMDAWSKRSDAAFRKLAAARGADVQSFAVKEIVGELDFVFKQLYQMKDVSKMMLEMAGLYKNDVDFQKKNDVIYGEGSTKFMGEALEAFYDM
ncbi:MerR family transcriptional regulator [Frisingicoccus sp.]|uniref:MerR family transcriptional regulator n=1 Tax=Frisingicoccus sp. TaxID=1918627 RepID=UPI003AB587D2